MIIINAEQNSEEWYKARIGVITASSFGDIITSSGVASTGIEGVAINLAYEIFSGKSAQTFTGNYYTRRGHELEPEAAFSYEIEKGVFVQEVGFIMNDDRTCGASPDRLVGDEGLLEIKCFDIKAHIGALLRYDKTGKVPAERIPQIQGQLMVSERKWCDLYMYHPDLPSLCVRVHADETYHSKLKNLIDKTIKKRDEVLGVLRK